jgi:large subunit ribosomal protein L24
MKLRKGDTVRVIQGKDIGKVGEVTRVLPERDLVIVDGVNIAKKHQAPTRQTMQGGIQDKAMPIHVSNVMLVCGKCGPARAGYRVGTDGAKIRICRSCGADL